MDVESEDVQDTISRPEKRFKHQSYKETLRQVHLTPAILQTHLHNELPDNESHFHEALLDWRELNLAPAFVRFANRVDGLSASMALLVHHWKEIIDIWLDAVDNGDDEALKPLLDLFQKLVHDLRTTVTPSYPQILSHLLALLPRSLAAETLSTLLTTFTALFKYVLIPTDVNTGAVQVAWSAFSDVLPDCDPEVQRAVAEVWGNALRRMKYDSRVKAVGKIAASASPDVGAWVFVCACKSVSQTLHTTTPSIFRPLLQFYFSTAPDSEALRDVFTVIRRVATALTHHCKTAEQYSPITDILLEHLASFVKEERSDEEYHERLRRLLEVLAVLCSVRGGSRVGSKHLATIGSQLLLVPLADRLQDAYYKLAVSCIAAGDMALWMGPGRRVFEYVWTNNAALALQMTGALLDLGWGGWQMIALPHVVKRTLELLEANKETVNVLQVLSAAQKQGKLSGIDDRWKTRLQKWVVTRFGNWEGSEDQVFELQHILTLSDVLPDLDTTLVAVVDASISACQDALNDEHQTSVQWVLGSCISCLSRRPVHGWKDKLNIVSWTDAITQNGVLASNGFLLDSLVRLLRAIPQLETTRLQFQSLFEVLKASLISHSRLTRLSVLRLLSSSIVSYAEGASDSVLDIVKRCLQAEEVSIDVQGVRERVLRIGRLNHLLREGDEISTNIVVRWLTAQLKVNLRPLWSPVTEALATISDRRGFGDIVWNFLFEELKSCSSLQPPSALMWPEVDEDDLDTVHEEERTWRDPNAHKVRCAVNSWLRSDVSQRTIKKALHVEERFDAVNYELQLLNALGAASSLAEKHNRDLVPYFLSIVTPEEPTKTLARSKVAAWLTLFAKFVNPKALYASQDLRKLYNTLLSHPDRQLQRLALDCMLTFKEPALVKHEDVFKALLDDTRWRDQLTGFEISEVEGDDRKETVDVFIRLLFGVMLEKKGKARSKGGLDRRGAVLTALGGCTSNELGTLVDLMLRPINRERDDVARVSGTTNHEIRPIPGNVSDKQLVGFLTLLGDVMKNLGTRLLLKWNVLFETLLDVIGHSQTRLTIGDQSHIDMEEAPGAMDDAVSDIASEDEQARPGRAIRTVRQTGLKRFTDFFRSPVARDFDFSPYLSEAFRAFISPRVPLLAVENTQAPTALLELFYTWTLEPKFTHYLVLYNNQVLPKVYDCLVANNVKPTVILRVFDIVDNLLDASSTREDILEDVFKPHIPLLLTNLAILVERTKGTASLTDQLGRRQISILSQLAPYMADSGQASALLALFTPILRKPSKIIPEKLKVDILNIVCNLLPLVNGLDNPDSSTYQKTYSLFSTLFQSLRSRQARITLVAAFKSFSELDNTLRTLADLLDSLNAYSSRRMEEPDFEKRLGAFAALNNELHLAFSTREWLPILYNMLNFIQDPEELSVRTNASASMKRFIDRVAEGGAEYETTFLRVLYPGIKNGLRSKNELVRAELLGVLAYGIQKCERIVLLQEMRPLLAAGDEEASFFNNILHLQIHRRTRALRRLVEFCDAGQLRSATLADIFVPLVGNFTTSGIDHHLVNEAINTLGGMARHLQWSAYYSTIQQYLRLVRNKDASERVFVRTLVALLDNFHFPMDSVVEESTRVDHDDEEDQELEDPETLPKPSDVSTGQRSATADVVNNKLLPNLLQHLEKRDENDDSLRIPIAVGIVQVAKHLPASTRGTQISRLVTVLSQVFRSKSSETRDLARDTLCKIATILGPSYLPEILRELRLALLRGPHLHVLAFVTHALIVHVTSDANAATFNVLDGCVNDVAHISAEVIFGESGRDVQNEGFRTKMKEVRASSSKGLDSFAIIAKHITPPKISSLLVPVRNILQQTETLKVMQQAEDVLRRIAGGLNANEFLVPVELLALCHTLISQNAKFLQHVPKPSQSNGKGKVDAVVELKRHLTAETDHYANNSFRFIVFGLELFNTAHRRNRFDFHDSAVIARLEPMVAVIGNTLYSKHMQVLVPCLKAASAIVKCPLKSIPKSLPVFIRQMIDIIKQTGSTESEVVQAAFKSLAAILRDQPTAQVKEKDLIFLIELLSPDLEDPERQSSVFMMLRAIVARKFVVPEIYDLMDRVSEIMVTNQSPQVQELCRGVLLQFLLDYPQGKGRLRNNMTFLAKNLSYVHESGRKSVMELLNAILAKFDPALIREYADLLFVALVMVIANDDSTRCREMASELIKALFSRLDDPQRRVVMSHIHSWASQQSQPQLVRVSSQVYGILIDYLQDQIAPYLSAVLGDLNAVLVNSSRSLEQASTTDNAAMDLDVEWQIPYYAMTTLAKIAVVPSQFAASTEQIEWLSVISHLLFPHAWVRAAACRLLGSLFSSVSPAAPRSDLPDDSPFSVVGLEDIARKLCLQLRSDNLDSTLGVQIVKNLFYIGKCFQASASDSNKSDEESDEEGDGEAEDEDEDVPDEAANDGPTRHPLSWLFSKLSYQARSAHIARRNKSSAPPNWFEQPACVLRWFAAMVSFLDAAQVEKFLVHILSPLYRIAEDDTIRDPHMDELKTLAAELQDLLQSKVGTTAFANVYNRIRQSVLGVRRERKTVRAVQAATNPEFSSKRKLHRNVAKKDNRKRKNNTFAEGRGRIKRRKDY